MPLSRDQEKQLLELVATGMSNPLIAHRIRLAVDRGKPGWDSWNPTISGSAVANYLTALMGRMGAINRANAVHKAHESGILGMSEGARVDVVHLDSHGYWSTSCRHGDHHLCKGECQVCGSPCRCLECHSEPGGGSGDV